MIVNTKYEKNKNLIAISLINELFKKHEKPVFLCVGSDKVLGDSVGALTGEILKTKHKIKYIDWESSTGIKVDMIKKKKERK